MKYPRAWIVVTPRDAGNAEVISWQDIITLAVTDTLYNAADSFELTLKNDKALSDYLRKEMDVQIYLGYVANPQAWSKNELSLVFRGKVDGVRPAYSASGQYVTLVGRDYAALLLDNEFNLAFAERTASQVAELLAEKYGLTPVVTPTTTIVERDLYKDKKEWQILQTMADREGFVCYVTPQKELYFGERQAQKDENGEEEVSATFSWKKDTASNIKSVTFDDSMLEITNKVIVRHFMGKGKQAISATAQNDDLIAKYGEKAKVVYDSKAKTYDLALRTAQNLLSKLCTAVVTFESMEIAGNAAVGAEKLIAIEGCGRFDGKYYVSEIKHNFAASTGYTCTLSGTNQQPDSAAQYRENLYETAVT